MLTVKGKKWIVVAATAMFPVVAHAQGSVAGAYPTKPIRLIVLSSPGSGPDILGRMLGEKLTREWGQQVIADTRPGASGIIGMEIASKAAPDGYTLVIITSQATIVSVMHDNLNYNIVKDFVPISLLGTTPFILAVHPRVAANSIRELIDLAKSKPGALRFGSGGAGSPPHLSAEILKSMTGIDMQHVPYKGVTPAMVDTIAGQVHMVISVIPAVLSAVRAGQLRALGLTGAKRSPIVPDLPTIAETVPGYEFIGWYSVFAPANTPSAIIEKLNVVMVKATQSSDMRERLRNIGVESLGSTPQDLAVHLATQREKMRAAVKASGARVDR